MIRRWFILGVLCLIFLMLLKDLYEGAIMYNPLQGIETKAKQSAINGREALSGFRPGWSKEIIDNNLFSSTRNVVQLAPQTSAQMKPVVQPPKKPELALKGIVLDQSGEYIAHIEKDKAKALPLRRGDMLDDIEIIDIREKSVAIKWNEETISLSLDKIKTIKKPR